LYLQFQDEQEQCEVFAGIVFFNPPPIALAEKTKVKNIGHAVPD
jgi:hypothetical protein